MPFYPLGPGAWLDASGSAWMPDKPVAASMPDPLITASMPDVPVAGWMPDRRVAASMPDYPVTGFMPDNSAARFMPDYSAARFMPDNSAQNLMPDRPRRRSRTPSSNPDWLAHADAAAMHALAVRKVQSRILGLEDPGKPRGAGAERKYSQSDTLWRWQPAYRLHAVVAELQARLVVGDMSIWWMPRPEKAGVQKAVRVFELQVPPESASRENQVDKTLRAGIERDDRLPEIVSQAGEILPFFEVITGISRQAAPRLRELLQLAADVTTPLLMSLKHQASERRPVERNSRVFPIIATPGHGSLPSGHATMAALYAELLATLLYQNDPERCGQLERLARRIAFNRVVAGVHFPMDSVAGHALGRCIALNLISAAHGAGPIESPRCEIDPVTSELREGIEAKELDDQHKQRGLALMGNGGILLVHKLWAAAADELKQIRT
jgi:hypothetical protein